MTDGQNTAFYLGSQRATGRIEDALARRALDQIGAHEGVAIVDGSRVFTYSALASHARRFCNELIGAGVAPGDHVAVHLEKTAEHVVAIYGIWMAGAVMVPINESLRSRQVEHIIRHSDSHVLVSHPRLLSRLDAQATSGAKPISVSLKPPTPSTDDDSPKLDEVPHGDGMEPAAILYTSGSTGQPKGIVVSHQNLRAGAEIVAEYLSLSEQDRVLSILPFSFDYGLNQLLSAVEAGASLYLHRSRFPADICRALVNHQITGLAGVPSLWIQLMQRHSPFARMKFPHLRFITNTGGVFPAPLLQRYRLLHPHVRIFLMYGLTEAFRSTFLPPSEVDRRPASIGKAIPRTEVLIVNENGMECGPGETGELVHRGPTVAIGYYRDPEATARVFRADRNLLPSSPDGRINTSVYSGDLVKKDAEGFIYFVGRRDQIIKSLGHRVNPDEIETVVRNSSLVDDVVAAPISDPVAGQAIVLHVIPRKAEHFSTDALMEYCRREMPGYMVPRRIHAHREFPRTTTGKVDRAGFAI